MRTWRYHMGFLFFLERHNSLREHTDGSFQ